MKIAQETAEYIYNRQISDCPMYVDELESFIAFKMKPVTGVLKQAKAYHETGIGQLTHVLASIDAAIDLLSLGE